MSKCFKCWVEDKENSEIIDRYTIVAMDRPYRRNLKFHKDCYRSIEDIDKFINNYRQKVEEYDKEIIIKKSK